ncbi:hypothetical protein [Saccharothrix texasensis]|uniref:Uncharacterized protein n=1 Tax=Saccharothrix texasensis TaxID=103734 RepID=A0A3N1HBE0_9PSEU|nr:hypothetical protein [Saccharothrix texasensis]ROP39815.1 hypothetical protein EDD40_5214 [Saccharothrix texasensis]
MTTVPVPVLLLAVALALVAVVLLWKVLVTAGLIGLAQWAVITQAENTTAVMVAVGVPAIVLAVLLRRATRAHHNRSFSRPPLYLRRQEATR